MDVGQLLTLLLGGGAVATITALFQGIKSLRDGARARDKDAVADLIKRRKDAEEERDDAFDARDRAFDQRDYWRNWAGVLEYTVLGNIPDKMPIKPTPPAINEKE